jgi:integral membrane protein (TIGR01906 family)
MSNLTRRIIKTFTAFLLPLLIILAVVRLLTTDAYLSFEYGKPGFPVDSYGFTTQQRFILASTNIHYVRAHLPYDELSKQTLNGISVYNEREVAHMADVQNVFQIALRIWQFAFILLILLAFILWKNGEYTVLLAGLRLGGFMTTGVILLIGMLAVVAWQTWFELFHRFLFQPGSWLFSYTDTLIRLFPVEFWYDATVTISVISFILGALLAALSWRAQVVLDRYALNPLNVKVN